MAAPNVCHIPPEKPDTQRGPTELPAIPPATPDIASLTATVNAMRQVLIFLTGQRGSQGAQGTSGGKQQPARWVEQSRVEKVERVFQRGDKTSQNYVDVKQINQLKMKDNITGESWTWNRDRG